MGPPQVTPSQMLSTAEVWAVQVIPSGLVITRLPVPVPATATNFSCPVGPPQVTPSQMLSTAEVWAVQVIPSGLVITRLPVPVPATATNFSCPVGPPQVTEYQLLSAADVWPTHVVPMSGHEVASAGFAEVKTQLVRSPRTVTPRARRKDANFIFPPLTVGKCRQLF